MENYKKINKAGHWVNIGYVMICFFFVPFKSQNASDKSAATDTSRNITENHKPFYTTLFDVAPSALFPMVKK